MKKTPYLKSLYLQKPLVLILLIAALATLPWLGVPLVQTETEQSELTVITSFVTNGDISSLNTPGSHSTISRLISAGASYFIGEVTPYTLRLPSALSFIALMGFCFMFFAHRRPVLEAFTSVLILITSYGIYFSSIVSNAYILPSFLIVGGIFEIYRWIETKKLWKLITSWIFWGLAVFELGWLILIAPFVSFLVFLIARKKPIKEIIIKPLSIAIPAMLLGLCLYWIFTFPNFQDFIHYQGLDNGENWNNFTLSGKILAPFSGFLPWTFLLLVALLVAPFIEKNKNEAYYNYPSVLPLDNVSQYNLLAAVLPFIGFLILPPSVLSEVFFIVCLLFTAIFLSRLIVHLSDMYPLVIRVFSVIVTTTSFFVLLIGLLSLFRIDSCPLAQSACIFYKVEGSRELVLAILLIGVLSATIVNISFLFRRKNFKILMATVGLIFALQLLIGIEILPYLSKNLHFFFN